MEKIKNCSCCGIVQNEETGYRKTATKFQSKCKKCFNEYCIDRWKQRKLDAIEYKGGKCQVCGYDKYFGALEFHHIDPSTKDCNWDKLRLKSWKDIKQELDKCICVCANCHREIHGSVAPQDSAVAF